MTVAKDLLDEFRGIATGRLRWEQYWRLVSAWVLPQTDDFSQMLHRGGTAAIDAVVSTPVAAERSKHIYDMTSLWGIDRLTAGLISLKTPESDYWHDLDIDNDFNVKATGAQALALETTRDYLFKVRANPISGFWPAHKAAVKSMCAFGDGWLYIRERLGTRVPFGYQFIPIAEAFPAVDPEGNVNRMFRPFYWTAEQCAREFGIEKLSGKVADMARDPERKHHRVQLLHAVRPRSGTLRSRLGTRGAAFESYYLIPDDEHIIGEGGYWDFPFTRYAWSNQGQRPYSEGPVAYAISEIQSLNALARDELLASQQHLRPPMATMGKNFGRLNFNPGANNPGLISGDGKQLFAPMTNGSRPDFATAVVEQRRAGVREALYLNLWQVLIADVQAGPETATEAMLRAQEKGEMLGPVGISLNSGLSHNVDREIGILSRKGAFAAGSPLAMPDDMDGAEIAPQFTSPLDRLRKVSQVIGAQRTLEIAIALEQVKPGTLARVDADEMLELAQDTYGAPRKLLRSREEGKAAAEAAQQLNDTATTIQGMQGAGEAARSLGEGAAAAAAGAEALKQSPTVQRALQSMTGARTA